MSLPAGGLKAINPTSSPRIPSDNIPVSRHPALREEQDPNKRGIPPAPSWKPQRSADQGADARGGTGYGQRLRRRGGSARVTHLDGIIGNCGERGPKRRPRGFDGDGKIEQALQIVSFCECDARFLQTGLHVSVSYT